MYAKEKIRLERIKKSNEKWLTKKPMKQDKYHPWLVDKILPGHKELKEM
jgi:hypothetical protein